MWVVDAGEHTDPAIPAEVAKAKKAPAGEAVDAASAGDPSPDPPPATEGIVRSPAQADAERWVNRPDAATQQQLGKIARGGALNLVGAVVSAAATFLLVVIVARTVDQETAVRSSLPPRRC